LSGEPLAIAALLAASALSAVALLARAPRLRSGAMLAALALCPPLVIGDQWHSAEVEALRDDPARAAIFAFLAAGACGALVVLFHRLPQAAPIAVVATLPFRVPIHAGGEESNLLAPLYVVLAAAAIAAAIAGWASGSARQRPDEPAAVVWLERMLALFVLLYAAQALYSGDFSNAVKTAGFFLVPFSVLFALMRDVRWDGSLLRAALLVVVAEAIVFALVAFVELAVRELIWNPEVITSNEFHVYFRVNSLFWDPNVFGRYLALALLMLAAVVIWTREQHRLLLAAGVGAILFAALTLTYSQSSYVALLAGLATLAALRWNFRWTAAISVIAVAVAVAVVAASGVSLDELNKDTGGREGLVSGGLDLFADRPLWGYGSGSFSEAFIRNVVGAVPPVSESHNEPITVAAEQGLAGLAVFIALLVAAFAALAHGLRGLMPGLGAPGPGDAARAAVLAAFVALLVHTLAYAGFFEDPMGWLLLAVGAALTTAARSRAPA
jgi:putative inorganic carbon (hco3(-)) transporter